MRWITSLFFILATTLAFALPSEQDVQAAVRQGDYAQAQTLMAQVVQGKPGSAKAHYVYAEILAHNGRFADATNEALQAKTLDPQIRFTNPDKFRRFEVQLLNAGQAGSNTAQTPRTVNQSPIAPAMAAPSRSSGNAGSNWLMIVLLVAAGFGLLIWLTRRRSEPAVFNGSNGAAIGAGRPAYGPAPMGPAPYATNGPMINQGNSGLGTGLMGAAGGFAAGMLVEEMLDHRGGGLGARPEVIENNTIYENGAGSNADQQLESQPIDFGNGNDWDNSGSGGFPDSALDIGNDDNNNW